jgi:hypothetical protein
MSRPLRVFLCHAPQDKPAVKELYQRLKSEDWIDPWLDEEKLSIGQRWTTAIEDALSDADVVLIFLSRNSIQKEGFVQRELNYAWELSLEKPRETVFLIPFRLDDCIVPRFLRSRHWGDYFGEKRSSTYQVLLRSLRQRYQQQLKLEKGLVKENANNVESARNMYIGEKSSKQISRNEPYNKRIWIAGGLFIALLLLAIISGNTLLKEYYLFRPVEAVSPSVVITEVVSATKSFTLVKFTFTPIILNTILATPTFIPTPTPVYIVKLNISNYLDVYINVELRGKEIRKFLVPPNSYGSEYEVKNGDYQYIINVDGVALSSGSITFVRENVDISIKKSQPGEFDIFCIEGCMILTSN